MDLRAVRLEDQVQGAPKPSPELDTDSCYRPPPTPKSNMLIGSRVPGAGSGIQVDASALQIIQSRGLDAKAEDLFPDVPPNAASRCNQGSSASSSDQWTSDTCSVGQIRPRSGKMLDRTDASEGLQRQGSPPRAARPGRSASDQRDQALSLAGGDTVFARCGTDPLLAEELQQGHLDLDLEPVQLDSNDEFPLTTVLPQA